MQAKGQRGGGFWERSGLIFKGDVNFRQQKTHLCKWAIENNEL